MTVPPRADGSTVPDLDLKLTSTAHYVVETDRDLEEALLELAKRGIPVQTITATELSEFPVAEAGFLTLKGSSLTFSKVSAETADQTEEEPAE